MSYKLTPEQYKDAARRRIDNPNTAENTNSAVSAYARMLNANRALDNKNLQKQTQEPEVITAETDDEQAEGNWFVRTLSTIAAPVLRLSEGLAKFVESSILDLGAGLVASVADLFGADETAKDIQGWAARDMVGEAFDWEPIQDIYNNSWSNEWGRFGEILQEGIYAVGNQAIPFALNFIPGIGTGLAKGLSIASYAMSGYGGGFEAASQDGGSVLGASAYGLVSAGLETLIEGVGGSMNFGGASKQGLSKVISKVAKGETVQALAGMVIDAVEEGAEEVISGMLDNYVKAMTYKSDTSSVQAYFENIFNAEPATQEELLEQFFVGAMAGGLMAGTTKVVTRANSSLRVNEAVQEMDELREKSYNLNQRGKDTTATEAEYAAKEQKLVAYVNKNLDKFNARKENGNKSATQILDYMDKNFNRDESGNFTTSKNALVKTENVSYGTTEADIERAVTSQGNTVHSGALEGTSAQAKHTVEKAINNINKGLGRNRLNLVVADIAVREDGTRDYGYLAGNTIVVDASMLGTDVEFTVVENGKPVKYKAEAGISTLLHEVFHFTEDTKAGKKLRDTLAQYAVDNDVETVNEVESAYGKESLNVQYSELSARQLERLLFNEKIINRLTEDNSTLAKRILHKAERLLNALKGENLHETKSVEALLKKTVKLYNKAILQVGKGKTYQTVARKGLDNKEEKEYSRRTTKYISYNTIGTANVHVIREELKKLYDGVENGIADGVAIEHGNTIYIVDSGKDNGELSFGVRKRKTIQDAKLRTETIRRINNESVSKGRISDGLSSRIGTGYDNNSGRNLRRELGKELSSDTRESANHEEGISGEVRYSRRITDEEPQSRRVEEDGREENREDGREARERLEIGGRRDNSRWRSVSYTDDKGRIHQLYELVRNGEKYDEINRVAQEIYTKPKTETQEGLQWHAKNEEINLYFVKTQSATNDFYVLDGNNLFIDENATEKQFVDILNVEKPIQRKVDNNKIAKISQKRWNNLLSWKPDAYVTRIPIQQFLDMTTQDYVEQRSINALSEQYAKKSSVGNIQNNYQEAIYLEVDFETGKVINHDGRHRLTELLNAGNGYADIFVIPSNKTDFESKARVEIEGQFDGKKYPLGLVRAKSERFARAIENTFRREDGNIRYSRRVITAEMSEQERYDALKDRTIENVPVAKEISQSVIDRVSGISSWEDINKYFSSEKKSLIRKLAKEFGVFKEYTNQDVELKFEFSRSNFNESYGKQKKSFVSFAKMFSVFDSIVENAVGIEVHNRNKEGYKADGTLKNVYVLVSAFEDDGRIVPVKLEIKEFLDKKNTLYVAIALESIKKDKFSRQEVAKGVAQQYRPLSSTISISDLLGNVNPFDKDFYKYIPKMFFENKNKGESDSEIRRSRRVISREDVSNAVEDTLQILTAVGNIDENAFDVSLERKNKLLSVYVTQLKEQAVNGRLTEKSKTVKNLVDAIFDNAVLTENYVDDLGESAMLLTSLRPYLHSIDLSAPSIKADVQQRYGKQNNIFRLWGKKNGGVAWDSALQAILEDVPALAVDTDGQGNNEISTLFNVFDSYTKAVADMKKQRQKVKSVIENTLNEKAERVFEIKADSELASRIKNSTQSKYRVIKEYLVEKFGDTEFTLSDGKKAIMDRSDAKELSHLANDKRIAELANIKELIENARLFAEETKVKHNKFDAFSYYKIKVSFEGETFAVLLNVGRAKNNGRYHIYSITNYNKKRVAGRASLGLSRPVGNAIKNDSSTTIIHETSEKSTQNQENSDIIKDILAKRLVAVLNESGTELVTKLTANKLQTIIAEERNALQETLRAVKNGESEIAFQGKSLSAKAKQQLGEIVDVIAKERASVYAEKKADAVIAHIKKGVMAEEMRDIRKTEAYKKISEYIAERRLQENKEISIKSIEESNPTAVFSLKQTIATVKRVRALEKSNASVLKQIRDMDTALLKQRTKEIAINDTPINLVDGLKNSINALYKTSVDGKRLLTSYEEMISSGTLKNLIASFREYCADNNPIVQDLIDSGMMDGVRERLEAYEKYVEALDADAYGNMSLLEKQTFHNAFATFLAEVVRDTKPTTNITVNGKTVSMKKYRDKSLRSIASSLKRDRNGKIRGGKRGFAAFSAKFFQESVRPFEAIAMAENYAGALEALYQEVRTGAIKGEIARADLEDLIYDFLDDKNNKVNGKKYDSVLTSQEVTIKHSQGEFVISKGELIGLYLTLIQEDGFMHADANNPMAEGIYFDDKEKSTDYRNKTALKFTAENLVEMEKLLNEKDLLFIEKVRGFFAEAGKLKAEVDMYLYGMERLLGEDYYPLRTDESARASKLGDKVAFYDELDPSGHLSINQSRTSGINALRVGNVLDVLTSYAKSVGLYYGVAIPIADMRLVYNSKSVYGDSIKTTIAKYNTDSFDKYFDKLLLDVQGAIKVSDSFLERQRQRYASFAVAANIKSPIKAFGGLFSLSGRLKTTAFLKGLTTSPFTLIKSGKADFSQMYEYCPATRIRYRDKQATLAAMNVERGSRAKNKLVDTLAIGIELVDKYTVYVAWNSAKAEAGAVGANANNPELLKKAGKLLDETLDTIDRFEMTERNAFSRSEDSFRRGLAMFTSSAQAQLTQFIDKTFRLIHLYNQKKHLPTIIKEAEADKAKYSQLVADEERAVEKANQVGDKNILRNAEYRLRKAKEMLNDKTMLISELYQKQATIDKDIKKAQLFTKKAIVSISMAIVVSAALSQLMSNLMGDEDEEETGVNFVYGMLDESLSNVFGMLPLVGQFYNALEFNIGNFEKKSYDMSFWVIDEWNALADALNGFVALMDGSGTKTPARVARDFAYALGQWFGIPTRNLFNAMNTVLKAVPSARYTVNDWFSKGSYGSDLKKAIDSKDIELADTIVRLMMKDTFGDTDTKVVKTVRSLYEQGYTGVIPKTVSSSITINGESYTMTQKQQAAFKRTYSQSDTAIEKLIGKQSFTTLSAKVQADSIKWIYDYYYQKAKEELTGIEDDSKKALFGSYINVETLAVAYGYCKSLDADMDKSGNAIVGTRKAKVVRYLNSLRLTAAEKYMILGYLGYSPVSTSASALITTYARKNGASNSEIQELLTMCNIVA
ncbi:MAG: hypothetical protein IJY05_03225 [Clostridia bacterium]|nr:hypothetical protein [Clostridia bacterium]